MQQLSSSWKSFFFHWWFYNEVRSWSCCRAITPTKYFQSFFVIKPKQCFWHILQLWFVCRCFSQHQILSSLNFFFEGLSSSKTMVCGLSICIFVCFLYIQRILRCSKCWTNHPMLASIVSTPYSKSKYVVRSLRRWGWVSGVERGGGRASWKM